MPPPLGLGELLHVSLHGGICKDDICMKSKATTTRTEAPTNLMFILYPIPLMLAVTNNLFVSVRMIGSFSADNPTVTVNCQNVALSHP